MQRILASELIDVVLEHADFSDKELFDWADDPNDPHCEIVDLDSEEDTISGVWRYRKAIRNGKKVKIKYNPHKKRKPWKRSAKQKQSLKKAQRNAKKKSAKNKRNKSMKKRKNQNLKPRKR